MPAAWFSARTSVACLRMRLKLRSTASPRGTPIRMPGRSASATVADRRTRRHQIGEFALHIGGRRIGRGGALRIDHEEGHVPGVGLRTVEHRTGPRIFDDIQSDTDLRRERAREIRCHAAHFAGRRILEAPRHDCRCRARRGLFRQQQIGNARIETVLDCCRARTAVLTDGENASRAAKSRPPAQPPAKTPHQSVAHSSRPP